MPLAEDVNLEELASEMEGMTGAEIESIYTEAWMMTLRESHEAEKVHMGLFYSSS